MAAILMGTDTCEPQLPESDPVISTDPAAVAALREGHADFMVVLTAMESEAPISLLPGSPYFEPLTRVDTAIPAISAISAAQILYHDESRPECASKDFGSLLFKLDVTTRARRLQRPRSHQLEVVFCTTGVHEADALVSSHLRGELELEMDGAVLSRLFKESTSRIMSDMHAYIDDFEKQQHRLLGARLGCPDRTLYDHDKGLKWDSQVGEHWCLRDGVRHGPYIKGDLSPLLDGVRLVEGHFDSGMRDGHWISRDEGGTLTDESHWSRGQQQPVPVTP